MKKYIQGTKFVVCSHDELLKKGWVIPSSWGGIKQTLSYTHPDFSGSLITQMMMDMWAGKTLTVKAKAYTDWYYVEENSRVWPVSTFLETKQDPCEEGMTPINGWIICKTCGENLRQIIKG